MNTVRFWQIWKLLVHPCIRSAHSWAHHETVSHISLPTDLLHFRNSLKYHTTFQILTSKYFATSLGFKISKYLDMFEFAALRNITEYFYYLLGQDAWAENKKRWHICHIIAQIILLRISTQVLTTLMRYIRSKLGSLRIVRTKLQICCSSAISFSPFREKSILGNSTGLNVSIWGAIQNLRCYQSCKVWTDQCSVL